jgi:hypothetical protein
MDLLQQYFIPADICEIVKIKPSRRLDADHISWAPDKQGLFTVRSAYWFAMDENWATSSLSSSSAPDGNRTLWDLVWKSDVPPKVQHFAWRLATNSLPTWCNKKRRNIEISDQCPLCGMEVEDNFHPFLRCPLAKDLWIVMSEVWQLPDIVSIQNTRTEWLLNVLSNIPRRSINMVLMTLWRSWHVRNEIVHDKVPPPAEVSKRFLVGYMDSLIQIKYYYGEDICKGKFILNPDMDNKNEKKKQ